MTKKRIKQVDTQPRQVDKNLEPYLRIDYPLFCFKYLQKVSYPECKDPSFIESFLNRLNGLSRLGWNEIGRSHRHAYGFEKLPREIIKPEIPSDITPDVNLLAFRAAGNNLPFVGFREANIFHVVYVETQFGEIYDHN